MTRHNFNSNSAVLNDYCIITGMTYSDKISKFYVHIISIILCITFRISNLVYMTYIMNITENKLGIQ